MQFNKTLISAALLTVGGFTAISANAATGPATDNFQVNMTVESSCTVAAGSAIDLGTIDAGADAPKVGSSTFNVACSMGTPYTISMLPSNVSSDGVGVMKGAKEGNDGTIAYQLASNSEGTTIWTDGSMGAEGTGTAENKPFEVYAKVTTDDFKNVIPDTYSETVTVSVAY